MYFIIFDIGFEFLILVLFAIAAAFFGLAIAVSWAADHIWLFLIYILIKSIILSWGKSIFYFLLDLIRSLIVLAFFVYFLGNGFGGDLGYLFDFLFVGAAVIYFSYAPMEWFGDTSFAQIVSILLMLGVAFVMYGLYQNTIEYYFLDLLPQLKPYIHP